MRIMGCSKTIEVMKSRLQSIFQSKHFVFNLYHTFSYHLINNSKLIQYRWFAKQKHVSTKVTLLCTSYFTFQSVNGHFIFFYVVNLSGIGWDLQSICTSIEW